MFKPLDELTDVCPICEDEKKLSYGMKKETLIINKQRINITSKIYHCQEGDHYFYAPEDEEKKFQDAYRKYREQNGLLQPEEIKEIREKYGLSQRAFARFLGWGEITIQRYETGALQDNAHNNLLLLIQETSNFERLFEVRKLQLNTKDVVKINKKLDEMKQSILSTIFKGSRQQEIIPRQLKQLQRIQLAARYVKPTRSGKGELELAS
jgi:putative zinc finger/helix-turn-helix YgiT family protein